MSKTVHSAIKYDELLYLCIVL